MKSIIQKFGLLIAATAVIFTGCKDKEDNPIVVPTFSLEIVSVQEGSPVQVEILTGTAPFEVSSASAATATATVSGNTITIQGVAEGTVSVVVTGSDGGKANLAVVVTARPANAPVLDKTAVEVDDDGGTATVTISGGTPGFTATSDHPNIATATVNGTTGYSRVFHPRIQINRIFSDVRNFFSRNIYVYIGHFGQSPIVVFKKLYNR